MSERGDEELLAAGRPPSPNRRLRLDIAVAIVVLGGAYLIARAVSHGNSTHQITTPTPTGGSSVSLTGPPPRGVFTFGAQVSGGPTMVEAAPCPQAPAGGCTSTHAIPAAVAAAVHRVFPTLVLNEVLTTFRHRNDAAIWSRTIAGHDRDTYLLAIVSRRGPTGSTSNRSEVGGQTRVFVRGQRAPYTVQIEIIGLSHPRPSLGQALVLANDPRLIRRG